MAQNIRSAQSYSICTIKNNLKATTNLKIYQILFKYGLTLLHFAMDNPVVSGIKIFATLIVRSQA